MPVFEYCLELFFTVIRFLFAQMARCYDAIPYAWHTILTLFIIYTASRFVILPVFGKRLDLSGFFTLGSDSVRKNKKDDT